MAYPKQLTDLFGSLECRLCGVQVSAPIVAKMHYSGKQHMKKVKIFLSRWSLETGYKMPEFVEPLSSKSSESSSADYCHICDIKLISVNEKLLHYSSKSHRKNENSPTKAKKRKMSDNAEDLKFNFGVGSDFSTGIAEDDSKVVIDYQRLVCNLCNVKAMSLDQFQSHLHGKKHREKLEKKDSHKEKYEKSFVCKLCNVSLNTPKLLKLHLVGKRHAKNMLQSNTTDFENFCEVCNLSFVSFEQYQMHIEGKKHEKKCQQTLKNIMEDPVESTFLACRFCPYVGNIARHKCDQSETKTKHDDLENKWVCSPCNKMVFDTEQELNEHKTSRKHLLCILNQENGDKVIDELRYCFVCRKQYRNDKDYTNHLFGEKHMTLSNEQLNLESKTDLFRCTVCDIVMDEQAKDEHMKDEKHLKQSIKTDTLNTLTKLAHEDIATNHFHCSNCDVTVNCFVKYSEHLLSNSHMDQMIRETTIKQN